MTQHHISSADKIYSGAAEFAPAITPTTRKGALRSHIHDYEAKTATGGAPAVADPNAICLSQSATGVAGSALTLATTLGTVPTMDIPRCLTIDNTGTATTTIQITGTDEYGQVMVEDLVFNGTTVVNGLKAFKTVTGVTNGNALTATRDVLVGTASIMGLPYALTDVGRHKHTSVDGISELGVTIVAAATIAATATTGDVRGTVAATTAQNGTRLFTVSMQVDTTNRNTCFGVAQFGG